MKRLALLLALLLASCSEPAPPEPPPPPPAPSPPAASQPPPLPVAKVTRDYLAAVKREVNAVISPSATPDSVQAIHDADVDAHHALSVLEAQGHSPTPQAVADARAAVKHLADVLAASP